MKINWNIKENKQLVEAFLSLKNTQEAENFLRDLMTEQEINEFSSRLKTASLLLKKVKYNLIIEETGLSSTTIARISKWLNGPLGGYRLVINRLSLIPRNGSERISFKNSHHKNPTKLKKGLSLNV